MHCMSWVCCICARELTPTWCPCTLRGIEWGVYIRAALAGITACSAGTFKQTRLPQGQNLYRLCMYANLCTSQQLQHSCTPLLQIQTPCNPASQAAAGPVAARKRARLLCFAV